MVPMVGEAAVEILLALFKVIKIRLMHPTSTKSDGWRLCMIMASGWLPSCLTIIDNHTRPYQVFFTEVNFSLLFAVVFVCLSPLTGRPEDIIPRKSKVNATSFLANQYCWWCHTMKGHEVLFYGTQYSSQNCTYCTRNGPMYFYCRKLRANRHSKTVPKVLRKSRRTGAGSTSLQSTRIDIRRRH